MVLFSTMGVLLKTNNMKISEVIKKLQKIQEEHGDVEVLYYTETDCHGCYTPVRNDIIAYEKEVNKVLFL